MLLLSLLSACTGRSSKTATSASDSPVTLTVGYAQAVGRDPNIGILQLADLFSSERLATADANGRIAPRIAARWSQSADGRTLKLALQPNVFFHDGTRVDAPAIEAFLTGALADPAVRARTPGLLDIAAVTATGPLDVTITLEAPSTFLLEGFSTLPVTKPGLKGTRIQAGPFFTVSRSTTEIVLQAHESYYRGRSAIDRVVLKPYQTLRTAWASLMRGAVDVVWEVPQDAIEFLRSDALATFSFPKPFVNAIVLNARRPPLQSAEVRRSLNMAIDRDLLVRTVFKGHARAASLPVWPLHWAYDASRGTQRFDPALAAATLESAGLRLAGSGRTDRPPSRLQFTCLVPNNFATMERLALMVQKQLYGIGVDMDLEPVPVDALMLRLASGDFEAAALDLIGGPILAFSYMFWHSRAEFPWMFGYANPAVDRALEDIRRAVDDDALRRALARLQQIMLDDPPAIFLAWGDATRAVSRRFEIPAVAADDMHALMAISDWRPARAAAPTVP